jgi:hypothetical protein
MEKRLLINQKYAQINELKSYLYSTDYHILKRNDDLFIEAPSPYVVPEDILMGRHDARENINALEKEIKLLEEELSAEVENEAQDTSSLTP